MKIEELVPYVEAITKVIAYREAKYGEWVFVVRLDDERDAQIRIRQVPRTKMDEAISAIHNAIKMEQVGSNAIH